MFETTDHLLGIVLGVLGVVSIVGGAWWKWERPRWQRQEARGQTIDAMAEVILGSPEVLDRSGSVAQKAQPGVPARIDKLDVRLDELQGEVRGMKADLHGRVTHLETVTVSLIQRVQGVEVAIEGCPAHQSAGHQSVSASPTTEES